MFFIELAEARRCGIVRCCFVSRDGRKLDEIISTFGLMGKSESLTNLSREDARKILVSLVGTSLVDGGEAVPEAIVNDLVSEFFDNVGAGEALFYTNGVWVGPGPRSWNPMTDSVYDGGVLAFGTAVAGCIWIEEDA